MAQDQMNAATALPANASRAPAQTSEMVFSKLMLP
jgi:hypothetical protein